MTEPSSVTNTGTSCWPVSSMIRCRRPRRLNGTFLNPPYDLHLIAHASVIESFRGDTAWMLDHRRTGAMLLCRARVEHHGPEDNRSVPSVAGWEPNRGLPLRPAGDPEQNFAEAETGLARWLSVRETGSVAFGPRLRGSRMSAAGANRYPGCV